MIKKPVTYLPETCPQRAVFLLKAYFLLKKTRGTLIPLKYCSPYRTCQREKRGTWQMLRQVNPLPPNNQISEFL